MSIPMVLLESGRKNKKCKEEFLTPLYYMEESYNG